MTRAQYERECAEARSRTVSEMRSMGYWSALDPAPESCGWQCFAIPPSADRREHQEILLQFNRPEDLKPQRFGEFQS